MQANLRQYLLDRIEREWESLPLNARPWGVWVQSYSSIPANSDGIDRAALERVWFLDRNGLDAGDIWEFRRLMVVHREQPWCSKMWKESSLWSTTKCYEIGLAAFAQYEHSLDAYLQMVWGGLLGSGWRITCDENGEAINSDKLWIA